jgi:non-specific serine/threonine protein kinase
VIGRRLAHYEIVEKLGEGGMGEVYRAHDEKLDRDVALKVLPEDAARDPERHARFVREARSIAALKHPNIVTVYSVEEIDGVTFLTMELVEGRSLSELIPVDGMRLDRFFDHSIPLSDAIGFAHDRGITHRDLKPGNIMVDREGRLKVLDFGLAKVLSMGSGLESMDTVVRTHDTAAGRILGTPAYMSPEQAEGKNIDHRSDIFSLGIVLYEMATGKRPFEGDTPISTISSILKDQPRPVSELKTGNPRELSRIISHCLEKDPERRFQTAKDVRNELEGLRKEVNSGEIVTPSGGISAADLEASERGRGSVRQSPRWLVIAAAVIGVVAVGGWFVMRNNSQRAVPPVPEKPGHAAGAEAQHDRKMAVVLPFENLGPADDAYFAAGVTEEITTRLASVSGLGVISRTSAENYDQKGKTMKQIGADLGVDYVLEGSVRWAKTAGGNGRVRITPQLVRVSDDTPMWTETYDREVKDIFDVQTDIATHVVDALGVTLQGSERERLEERPTSNVDAYAYYLQAKNFVCNNVSTCDGEIVALYEKAVALDPTFLAAWCELARHHLLMYHVNFDRTEARLARAKTALDHAEAIDAAHPLTRLARGYYYYHGYRDYDRALVEFNAVAEGRPNDGEAIYSVALIERRRGQLEESARHMEHAVELDPKNADILSNLADTYDALRLPDQAQETYDRAFTIVKDPSILGDMVQSHLRYHGDAAAARRLLARAPDPNSPALEPTKVMIALTERDFATAVKIIRSFDTPPSLHASMAGFLVVIETQQKGLKATAPALEDAARQLEASLRESPGNYVEREALANVYAFAGRADDAIGQAKLAVDMVAKDAYAAPGALGTLAGVYAHTGHPDEALDLIGRLLTMNYDDPLTIVELKSDPYWDPLRDNPKFKALLNRSS